MELRGKKEFFSLILIIIALVLTLMLWVLSKYINNQGALIATSISIIVFMYGMVTYSMEKMKLKSDKLLIEAGTRFECKSVHIKEHKFMKIPSYYSFYFICEYIDFDGNLQEVKSKPYVVKEECKEKLQLINNVVVYIDKSNIEIYYIDFEQEEIV